MEKQVLMRFLIVLIFISNIGFANNLDTLNFRINDVARRNLDSAILLNDLYYNLSLKIDTTDQILVDAIDNYATCYARSGEFIKGAEKAKNLVLLHNERISAEGLSKLYNTIGICYVRNGVFDSTITYFKKALEIRQSVNDSVGVGASLNNIGMVSSEKADYDTSIYYLNLALRVREAIGDSAGIASTTNNIGIIYYHQLRFKEAIPYYKKALLINQSFHNVEKEIMILTNLGNIYDELNELDSTYYFYKKATIKAKKMGDKRLISMTYGNLAFVMERMGKYNTADSLYKMALELRIEMNDIYGLATVYNQMAGMELHAKNYSIAINYFKKSIDNALILDAKRILRESYMGISMAYDSIGDVRNSLKYLKNHLAMKDSVFNLETNEQIEEIQTKYETEKKEKKLAEQKVVIAEKNAQVQKQNFQLLSLGGGVISLLLIGGIVYTRQRARQEKLKQQVALEKSEALNKVQNEKLRISRDLHDNIGSQLTFVISSLDNMDYIKSEEKKKEKLTQLSSFTKDTMNQLRETIWAIKSESISVEQLVAKVAEFVDKAKVACPHINFSINGKGNDFQLNSNQAINTYRVIQEAINNAIKYSEASEIILSVEDNKLKVVDTGKGFDLKETKSNNGLINMRARMKEVGFRTEIESEIGKGTKVSIYLS